MSSMLCAMQEEQQEHCLIQMYFPCPDTISRHIIEYYYSGHKRLTNTLLPLVRQQLEQDNGSPHYNRMEALYCGHIDPTKDDKKYMHALIVKAIEKSFEEQQAHIVQLNQENDRRWTRKKAALLASATGICTAVISGGVSLAIHFS